MDRVGIGEAARVLGLRPSALRYYEQRGLLPSAPRQRGRRTYGRDDLRRLAFLTLAQRLGIPLATAAAVLDAPGPDWQRLAREQIDELTRLVERARAATSLLTHTLECPSEHPARDCSTMLAALDRLLDGVSLEQLGREQMAGEAP